jgi:hypothetical protein
VHTSTPLSDTLLVSYQGGARFMLGKKKQKIAALANQLCVIRQIAKVRM